MRYQVQGTKYQVQGTRYLVQGWLMNEQQKNSHRKARISPAQEQMQWQPPGGLQCLDVTCNNADLWLDLLWNDTIIIIIWLWYDYDYDHDYPLWCHRWPSSNRTLEHSHGWLSWELPHRGCVAGTHHWFPLTISWPLVPHQLPHRGCVAGAHHFLPLTISCPLVAV